MTWWGGCSQCSVWRRVWLMVQCWCFDNIGWAGQAQLSTACSRVLGSTQIRSMCWDVADNVTSDTADQNCYETLLIEKCHQDLSEQNCFCQYWYSENFSIDWSDWVVRASVSRWSNMCELSGVTLPAWSQPQWKWEEKRFILYLFWLTWSSSLWWRHQRHMSHSQKVSTQH